MDHDAEAHAVDALSAETRDRIVVVASHRPEILRMATRVVVLESGRVVEDGPPGEIQVGSLAARLLGRCADATAGFTITRHTSRSSDDGRRSVPSAVV